MEYEKIIKFILTSSPPTHVICWKGKGSRNAWSTQFVPTIAILMSTIQVHDKNSSMHNHIAMCNWKLKKAVIKCMKYWFGFSRMKPIKFLRLELCWKVWKILSWNFSLFFFRESLPSKTLCEKFLLCFRGLMRGKWIFQQHKKG